MLVLFPLLRMMLKSNNSAIYLPQKISANMHQEACKNNYIIRLNGKELERARLFMFRKINIFWYFMQSNTIQQ